MITFHDRRTESEIQEEFPRPSELYGKGMEGLFPEGRSGPSALVPWQQRGELKHSYPYDRELVANTVNRQPAPPDEMTEIDPRILLASQGRILHQHLAHYMGPQFQETRTTSADQNQKGNIDPVVYTRQTPGHEDEHIILSGHHRAAAALLQGHPLLARHIVGGWGGPR